MTVLLENVSLIRFLICVHLRHLRTISSLHTGPHAHALTNHRQSPLMGELLAVLLEQPFGVDAVPLERATPEVVDEQVTAFRFLTPFLPSVSSRPLDPAALPDEISRAMATAPTEWSGPASLAKLSGALLRSSA